MLERFRDHSPCERIVFAGVGRNCFAYNVRPLTDRHRWHKLNLIAPPWVQVSVAKTLSEDTGERVDNVREQSGIERAFVALRRH
jgi:hypothetical protein